MENNSNPKKSKALIITFVIVLLLLIIGFFLFTNSDKIFGTKGVINLNKVFSPLITSDNSKNLTPIDALAGEDIAKGDNVSVTGKDANGNPIVIKTTGGGTVYGIANQNIKNGSIGPVVISSPSLWASFTNFVGNLFGGNKTQTSQTVNGTWSTGDNGKTGTFTGSNGNGTWVATSGTGGTGIVTWTGNGDGTGTWTSSTGSGTWTNGTGTGGNGTGTWGTPETGSSSYSTGVETWSTLNNGSNGTWTTNTGSGTWVTTNGTGGIGDATWISNGDGTGTWTSSTGSGTWTTLNGMGLVGTGTWNSINTGSSSSYTTANGWSYNYANGTWTPPANSTLPSVSLTATPTSVASGGKSLIRWTSKNTTSCNAGIAGRTKGTSGSFTTAALTTGTSYSVVCTNGKGSNASANIYVGITYTNNVVPSVYPSVTLKANTTSVVAGKKAIIQWTSKNTTSCNAGIAGRTKGTSGSFSTAALTTGTSYSVTCVDAKGSNASANIYIDISTNGDGSSSGYNTNNSPLVTVTATPASVESGSSSEISWFAKNATICNEGVTGRTKGTSGSFDTGDLTKGKEYSVTCSGPNGSSSENVIVSVIGENDPPTVSAIATPSLVNPGGKSIIKWTSTNATSCNDGTTRPKNTAGSFLTGNNANDTAYTVTCIGAHGTASSTAYVFVNDVAITKCPYGGTPPNCLNAPTGGSSAYKCSNGTDNYPTCTTVNGKCLNGATNDPLCTTKDGKCLNGSTNPPLCNTGSQACPTNTTGTYPFCIAVIQTCDDLDTLEFTEQEQQSLEALLRRYYILAEKIKTDNDIIQLNNDLDKSNSLIARTEDLVKQCYTEINNPLYVGPKNRRQGNPWFSPETDSYANSIWPINPYTAQTPSTPLDINKYGFNEFPRKLWDITGDMKYYDNWVTSVNNKSTSYLNPTDWNKLNTDTNFSAKSPSAYWTSYDSSAAPAVIEYLFRIW